MKNIYLVGFMGTGKSSAGELLAKKLDLEFLDLDSAIEKKEGREIKEIFAKQGEAYFRKIEKELVQEVSKRNPLVVACGGGAIIDKENLGALKNSGKVICLTARPEVILERCNNCQRPLLNIPDPSLGIIKLLSLRAPFYAKADLSIDTSDLTLEQVTRKIIDSLK